MHGIFRAIVRSGPVGVVLDEKRGKLAGVEIMLSVCTLMYAYVLLRT